MATTDTRNRSITEKVSELSEFGIRLIKSGGADTTLASATVAGAATYDVASATGIAAEEYHAIGLGNTMDIAPVRSLAAVTVTPKAPLLFAHATADRVVELEDIVLGEVAEDGVTDEFTAGVNVHLVGTRHGPWDSTPGHHEQTMSAQVINCTLDNLKQALGHADAGAGGSGTLAAPWYLNNNPETFAKGLLQSTLCINGRIPCVYVKGEYLNTGQRFEIQYWSCTIAGGDYGLTLAVGNPTMVQFRYHWFANRRFLRHATS